VIPHRPVAKAPRKARALVLRTAHYIFLAFGVFALSYSGYVIADAHIYQTTEQSRFESASQSSTSKSDLAQSSPGQIKDRLPLVDGNPIGEMEIPRLGFKAVFVQGDSPRILRHAVGHISDTALPGDSGNVVLTGHRDTFFRPLRNIQTGDAITLKTVDGDFQYQVESTAVVPPSDVQVLEPSSERTLTLITCFPFYYVGPAPNRFIVRARQLTASTNPAPEP
jgi:sortase A